MTPGALRAGRSIHAILKRHLPTLPASNADTLAAIIDAEIRLDAIDAEMRIAAAAAKLPSVWDILLDAMTEARDLIDRYADVKDGDDGQQVPNNAMRAQTLLDAAIDKAKWEKAHTP